MRISDWSSDVCSSDLPKIAILVTELGGDAELGVTAIDRLPAGFGLAFLPGQAATRTLARRAAADGHEVWVGLPMPPKGSPRVSPGPTTLLVDDPSALNATRVAWALAQVARPSAAYQKMGSGFPPPPTPTAPL